MANKVIIRSSVITEDTSAKSNKNAGKSPSTTTGQNKDEKKNIKLAEKKGKLYVFPLLQDVQLNIDSKFTSISEMIPTSIKGVLDTMDMYTGAGGSVSAGTLDFKNLMDVERWSRTSPLKVNMILPLFAQTNPYEDVYQKVQELVSLTIPSWNKDTERYDLPGISLSTMFQAKTSQQDKKDAIFQGGKFVSFEIPGVIYLPLAMVTKALPTFSKETTESGFPLWATIEFEVTGLGPMTSKYFDMTSLQRIKSTENNR